MGIFFEGVEMGFIIPACQCFITQQYTFTSISKITLRCDSSFQRLSPREANLVVAHKAPITGCLRQFLPEKLTV